MVSSEGLLEVRSQSRVCQVVAMVSLVCVMVGIDGVFVVDIDPRRAVAHLKRLIKKENPIRIKCEACPLKLVFALNEEAWVASGTKDMAALKKGETTPTVDKLLVEDNEHQGEVDIEMALSSLPEPSTCQVLVLVVVPDEQVESVEQKRRYKRPSSESSSRKMLDALAYNLAGEYNFKTMYYQSTIGDVFHANNDNGWSFRSSTCRSCKQLSGQNTPPSHR